MDERLALMRDVAGHKWNSSSAIEDVPREQRIIDGLKAEASALGVPEAWAERFFRAQIEAAKLIQREYFVQWERAGASPVADAPDLATVTRSRLDSLTPEILRELAVAWPALADPAQLGRIALTMRGMQTAATSGPAAALAIEPLIDGSSNMGTH